MNTVKAVDTYHQFALQRDMVPRNDLFKIIFGYW